MFYFPTLSIAGTDSSGGAGTAADLKTMSALGCYAMTVVTAVTAQNTMRVSGVHCIPPSFIGAQLQAVLADINPLAIKLGMVPNEAAIRAVTDTLLANHRQLTVTDPIMVSSSGTPLMEATAIEAYRQHILPLTQLLTPNLPEAEQLTGLRLTTESTITQAAHQLMAQGCQAVLIKGGHRQGNTKTDFLYLSDGHILRFHSPTIETINTHGTGCTLSAAITAYIARGYKLPGAVRLAKDFLNHALAAGALIRTGHGHGPLDHFFAPLPLFKQ